MNIRSELWILVLISLGILRPTCRASDCFVKPTDPANSACSGEPCYTLSEYASGVAAHCFGSNVTVWFLSGTHALNQSLQISYIGNFTLTGINSASIPQIACETNTVVGLSFTYVFILTMKNIDFVNCSGSRAQHFASIHFHVIMNLTVTNVLIRNCSHIGLGLHNILGYSVISSVILSNNSEGHIYIELETGLSEYSHITLCDTVFEFGKSPLIIIINADHVGIDIINITTHGCIPEYKADIELLINPWKLLSSIEVNIEESEIAFSAGAAISIILPYRIDPPSLPSDSVTIRIMNCDILSNHQGGIFIIIVKQQPRHQTVVYNHYSMPLISIRISDSLIANNGMFTHSQGSGLAVIFPGDMLSGDIACRIDIDNVHFTENNYAPILSRTKFYFTTEYMATVFLAHVHNVTFSNCSFVESNGTAICAYRSSYHVFHKMRFIKNTAYQGGAMGCYGNSSLIVHKDTHLIFIDNYATNVGGAIFVEEKLPLSAFRFLDNFTNNDCFLWFPDKIALSEINIKFTFLNNTALRGGDAIYGELFETCITGTSESFDVFTFLFLHSEFEPNITHTPSVISSDPVHVCFCENGFPLHATLLVNEVRYPGEPFNISAVLVGRLLEL